jgi:hypothetical protein
MPKHTPSGKTRKAQINAEQNAKKRAKKAARADAKQTD